MLLRHAQNGVDEKHPLDPADPVAGSWIIREVSGEGVFGVGCSACRAAGKGKTFGQLKVYMNLNSSRFLNHERSRDHQQAIALMKGIT